MKNISLILNVVLLAAVLFLFIDRYAIQASKTSGSTESAGIEAAESSSGKVAYISLERLLTEYEYAKVLNENMMKMLDDSRAHLKTESENFESDYYKYEAKAKSGGFLSQASMENQQAELLDRQKKLQEKQYNLENQLMEEQQRVEAELYKKIVAYLEIIRTEHQLNYIVSLVPGSDILVADTTLNVTDVVLEGLNKQYQEEKTAN